MAGDDDESPAPATDLYVTAIANTRATAKWLIGAFAAVGSAMLAGLQLTGLGKLSGDDLTLAILAVTGAILGVGIAIYSCAQVLIPAQVTLTTLAEDPAIEAALRRDPILKGYATDAADLRDKYNAAVSAYHEAWATEGADVKDSPANKTALKVQSKLMSISAVAEIALRYGGWVKVNRAYLEAKDAIGLAALMVLAGMLGFAYLAHREDPFTPGVADATPTKLVSLSFNAAERTAWKPLLGEKCDLAKLPALILSTDQDSGEVELVSLPTIGGCQSRHFKLRKGEGATLGAADVSVPADLAPPPS